MRIIQTNTKDLIPYAANSRTHSDEQVAQIAGSIKEFGFNNPVLMDADKGIIAGHGRVLAAHLLGLKKVPCIILDHLTDAQKKAFVIADNKLALNAGWDDELLKIELSGLKDMNFDLSLIGFDPGELSKIMVGSDFMPGSFSDQQRLDQKTKTKCPSCGHEFEIKNKTKLVDK